MARYRHQLFAASKSTRFCVIFDLQWQVLACTKLPPAADLKVAMEAIIAREISEGWQPEGSRDFGFVFLRRAGMRRLLILTERDPYNRRPQSFSPF